MSEFTLSTEQEAFILSALQGNNILVDACIGSGKTTAIQHLCNRLPDSKSILYLTYNRLLKIDAQKKIIRQNIVVTNYHGYAYEILKQLGIKSSPQELIQNFLKIKPTIASFDLLIIDEYQDIISELADMLEYIKSANPSMQIVAVGDMSQKIYDFSSLNVTSFISDFLGNHVTMNFTQCFRLSQDHAAMLGRIWGKPILGTNTNCSVERMDIDSVVSFLSQQNPQDILCLGNRKDPISN